MTRTSVEPSAQVDVEVGGEVERFDAVVIGTGQGGKPLAGALAEAGWRTAIVERDRVGGTCVVRGCTPTKTMIASARIAHLARRAHDYGVRTGEISVDLERVRERKRGIVDSWSEGSRKGLERHDALELVMGDATFVAPRVVKVELRDGGTRRLTAPHVFVNVGGRPTIPPVRGLEEVEYLTSASIMELGEVPEHLVVLGGGFIGLEFGQMFRRFGAKVTVLERSDRIASREDEDVSEALREIFEEEGIEVRTGVELTRVSPTEDGGVRLTLESHTGRDRSARGAAGNGTGNHGNGNGSEAGSLEGSHLLVAVGRTPNSDGLGLEAAGISTDDRGHIEVDERLETSCPGVYALGDVIGAAPFTHTSYDDYRVLRANLLEDGDEKARQKILPYAVFTDPQLGRVGRTEREAREEAREEGREVRVAKLPMSRVARAIEVGETRGFMKAVVDARTDRILGAAILGIEGGEVVSVLQAAMMGELPYTALRDATIAHPTLAESLNNLFMELD